MTVRADQPAAAPSPTQPVVSEQQPRHDEAVAELYAAHFGAWASERFAQRRHWQFEAVPWADELPPRNLVAVAGDRVVGLMTASPLPLRTPRGPVVVASTGDLAVEKGYPILPLQLSREHASRAPVLSAGASPEAERIGRAAGSVVVPLSTATFTYPLRHRGAIRRALRRRLPHWLCPAIEPWATAVASRIRPPADAPQPRPVPALDGAPQLCALTAFDARYDALWRQFAEHAPRGLDKDARYMTWRYLEAPVHSVHSYGVAGAEGTLTAAVVLGSCTQLDDARRPCGTTGEILELIVRDPENRDLVTGCLVRAIELLDRAGVDNVRTTGLCKTYHRALLDLGFARDDAARHRLAVNLADNDLGDEHEWYVSAGDGDQLYATLL